jgi:hypothetical protein
MHYKFLRDLKDGQKGEAVAYQTLLSCGKYKKSKEKPPSQKHGDFQLIDKKNGNLPVNIEVKYDILAETTGNMCFEFANGKGEYTGIMSTQADVLTYVLNNKGDFSLYLFVPTIIKQYLFESNSPYIRIVNGGDKKKYSMALAPVLEVAKKAFLTLEVKRATLQIPM